MKSKNVGMTYIFARLFCLITPFLVVPAYADTEIAEPKGELVFRNAIHSNRADYVEELLTLAYQDLGYKVKYINVPLKRALFEADDGKVDGELLRIEGLNKSFPNLISVPYKLFDFDIKLIVNQRQCPGCQLAQLRSISYVRGVVAIERLLAESEKTNQSIGLASMEILLDFFNMERAQGIIAAVHDIPKESLSTIDFSEQTLSTLSVVHYLHKRHGELVMPLSRSLFNLERNGIAQRLREKYVVKPPKHQLAEQQLLN